MTWLLSGAFFVAAIAGCFIVGLQVWQVRRFVGRLPRKPARTPPVSVLKPLCGIDDLLEENLRDFAALDYPDYEVLLGLRDVTDAAWPVACAIAARWPRRFRVVLQHGEPGLNPKINQLITLQREARHDILVVSDSNVRVDPGYLADIVARFEDPDVALVCHPVIGTGWRRLGSLFDAFYMTTHFSTGVIAAKEFADQDLVIGKSMAFRRADLDALGGFESAKDVLAEDYVMGRRVKNELHRRVAVGRFPVVNVSENRSLSDFVARYNRWSIMQRRAGGMAIYCVHTLMYPLFLAALGFVADPTRLTALLLGAIALYKVGVDMLQGRMLRPGGFPLWMAFLVPLHDMLVGWCWFHGLLHDRVEWRGNVLEVLEGTRLARVRLPAEDDEVSATEEAAA